MPLNPIVQRYMDEVEPQTPPSTRVVSDPVQRFMQFRQPPPTSTALAAKPGSSKVSAQLGIGTTPDRGKVQQLVHQIAKNEYGWDGAELDALDQLIEHESGYNPYAKNPSSSASGLFQKLTSMHGPLENTLEGQIRWGLNYIKGRPDYGTPSAAWSLWQSRAPHWY